MKITVTLLCRHDDGYSNHEDLMGSHAVISARGVLLDGKPVVWRDRRARKNREAGHPWVSSPRDQYMADEPYHQRQFEAWTGFSINVEHNPTRS